MTAALRSVLFLLTGYALLSIGTGLISILLPVRMGIEGASTQNAGLVMSAYYAGFVAGSLGGPRLIGRVGHIRAFAAMAAMLTAAILVQALYFDLVLWGAMRALVGVSMAGLCAVIESWLNVKATNEMRGQVLSLYTASGYLAGGIGQLFINVGEVPGIQLFCVGALLASLSLVPIVLTSVPGPDISRIKAMGLGELYRASPLGVIGTGCAGLLSGSLYGLGAIYAGEIGMSVFEVSVFMGAPILGGFLLQYPIGKLSDRFDRRSVLLAILLATVAATIFMASMPKGGTELALPRALIFLLGGTVAVIYPLTVSHAFDYIDSNRMVSANSAMLLAWAMGATVGPLVASVAMGQLGPRGLFVFMAAVAMALALFTLWRMLRRVARPSAEQTAFVQVPATTGIAGALDPRTVPLPEFHYDDEDPGDR